MTKDTTIKLANAELNFADLHVGDRIQVLGTAKSGNNGDLQAYGNYPGPAVTNF